MRVYIIAVLLLIVYQARAQSAKISGFVTADAGIGKTSGLKITIVEKGVQKTTAVQIGDNGSFLYDFGINGLKEVILDFQSKKSRLLVRPNDDIIVKLNDINGLSSLQGKYLSVNDLFFQFSNKIDSILNKKSSAMGNIAGQLTINQYKQLRFNEFNDQVNELNIFLEKNNITDTLFRQTIQSDIVGDYYYDLTIFPFYGSNKLEKEESPFTYFDFFLTNNSFPSKHIIYSSYNRFIDCLEISVQIICNTNVQIKKNIDQMNEAIPSNASAVLFFENIRSNFSNKDFYHDLLWKYLKQNFKKVNNSNNSERVLKYIRQEISQDRFDEIIEIDAANQHKNILDFLNSVNGSKRYVRLTNFFKQHTSKLLFLDFWFTNCAPCIAEFPYYEPYLTKYKNKVDFIFIGVHMNEKEWKEAIRKYKLGGVNILLNDSETALLQSFLEINGYPHHTLIEKGGRLNSKLIKDFSFKSHASLIEDIFRDLLK